MPPIIAQEALNLQTLLAFGLATVPQVIRWADQRFVESPTCNNNLADVSLAVNAQPLEMYEILKPLIHSAPTDPTISVRIVLGEMHHQLTHNPKDAPARARFFASALENFANQHLGRLSKDISRLSEFNEEFFLADNENMSTPTEILKEFINALEPYSTEDPPDHSTH